MFAGASEDGRKALFLSPQQLTDAASQDPSSNDSGQSCPSATGLHGCNLYLFDQGAPVGHGLVDVSVGDSSGLGGEVQGVMAVSGDGSHVYFVAKGVLAGKNGEGREPLAGGDNLYLYVRDGAHASGRMVFIATLPGDEAPTPRNERAESEEWHTQNIAASVSAGGGVLVFTSHGALTADATRVHGPAQVYRFDADSERLLRVSIGEHGFNDNGNQGAGEARLAITGSVVTQAPRGLSMSSDGAIVFFESPVGLTPGAPNDVSLNGRVESVDLVENVYEWEALGKGGCAQATGCIHLISDGHDVSEGHSAGSLATFSSVELLGTDPAGENVFFATADPLVGTDTDSELDIYDARVRGGFPAPVPVIPCEGEGCREPGSEEGQPGPFGTSGNLVQSIVTPPPTPHVTGPSRAVLLTRALKACRKQHGKHRRLACEKRARKRYGPVRRVGRHRAGGRK
jgi:hypothetical protein